MESDAELVLTGMAAAPLIMALVAATGALAPRLPRRAYPAVAVAYGVAWQSAAAAVLGSWSPAAPLAGVVIGLAASGLYSGAVRPAADFWRSGR